MVPLLWSIAVVVGAFLALILHEASHVVVVKLRGGTTTSFKPYPHVAKGRFYVGRMTFQYDRTYRDTKWRHASPLLINVPMAALYSVGALWCPYLWVFAACSLVDHLWWWRGYFGILAPAPEILDGWRFRYYEPLTIP